MPYDYTVAADEPEAWQDHFEFMRDAMLAEGYTHQQIREAWASDLADMRAARYAKEQQEQAAAMDHLRANGFVFPEDLQNGNGTHPHDDEEIKTARFSSETWAEFRDHTDEEINYLVGGLVATGSLVFVASEPKAGKTWLALALAVSVASGTQYLERFSVHQAQPVLYLALEGHRTDYRTRLGCISRGLGVDPDGDALELLTISYQPIGIDLMDPAWASALSDEVDRTGARIVFVDVLRDGAPRLREDGQGSGDFAVIKTHIKPLLKRGVTVVLVHHFSKRNESNRKRTIGEMMSGSGSLYGAADLIVGITTNAKEWENMRVEFVGRNTPAPDPFRVQSTGDRTGKYGGFRYVDSLTLVTAAENADAAKPAWTFAKPMADWIKQQGRRVRTGELQDQFKVHKDTIANHRDDLEAYEIEYVIDPHDRRNSGYESTSYH